MSTLGKITVIDEFGNAIEGIQSYYATVNFRSVLHFIFEGDLEPEVAYTVTLAAGIEDLHGNAIEDDFVFTFTVRPREVISTVIIDEFNTHANPPWWQFGQAGQTRGINTTTSVVATNTSVIPRQGQTGSVSFTYEWSPVHPDPFIRWHRSVNTPTFANTDNLEFYLFGDGSGSQISAMVQNGAPAGGTFFGYRIDIDWIGWRRISIDIFNTPNNPELVDPSNTLENTPVLQSKGFAYRPAPEEYRIFEPSSLYFSRLRAVTLGDFIEERDSYTVTFSVVGDNGEITADDVTSTGHVVRTITSGEQVFERRNVAFTATPDEKDAAVRAWTVNGTVVAGETGTTLIIESLSANAVVTVEFEATSITHTVTFSVVAGEGTITATVDGETITSGAEVAEGSDIVFTANPAANYEVQAWTIMANQMVENETGTTFTLENLTSDVTVMLELVRGVGVGNIFGANFSVFPNPFANVLHITDAENSSLQIVDATGAVVFTQQITSADEVIHLGELAVGVYFLHLEKDGQRKTVTVVKR